MFRIETDGLVLAPNATVRDAIALIDKAAVKVAITLDPLGRLAGIVTDGDIRRALLEGIDLNCSVNRCANKTPAIVRDTTSRDEVRTIMQVHGHLHVPILDPNDRPIGLWLRVAFPRRAHQETPVLLMAGGEGQRLRPETLATPKPLLLVGGKPILQRIIEGFRSYGFNTFIISINYLGHQIESHFGDGSNFDVDIEYIHEEEKLGTAGSLSLLPHRNFDRILVSNGDLLTDANIAALVDSHVASGADATLCVREHRTQLPFGVVSFEGSLLTGLTEKPTISHFVNAGLYCLSRSAITGLDKGAHLDMPDLFTRLHREGKICAVHPITDARWIDIGTPGELARARAAFGERVKTDDI